MTARFSTRAPKSLESEPAGQLDLSSSTDGSKYSTDVVGETTGWVFEDCVSVSSKGKRTLRVTRHCEIGMIQQIVRFHSKRELRTFLQFEPFLELQIKLRERGAAQDVTPRIAILTWEW